MIGINCTEHAARSLCTIYNIYNIYTLAVERCKVYVDIYLYPGTEQKLEICWDVFVDFAKCSRCVECLALLP